MIAYLVALSSELWWYNMCNIFDYFFILSIFVAEIIIKKVVMHKW